jgi:hypothetical protein
MVAVIYRCHQCGTPRASDEQLVCAKCGAELPVPPVPEPAPDGGIAWTYRIPLLNNPYIWRQWAWTALAVGGGFAAVIGTFIVAVYGDSDANGIAFGAKVYAALGLIPGLMVIGYGLFAALGVSFGVTTRFALSPDGVVGRISKDAEGSIESSAWLFAGNTQDAQRNAQLASLLLPSGCDAKWKDVRRAEFDEHRNVITLRRRWHFPVRIYVPAARFAEAVAFVREHLPATARGVPPRPT